MLSPNQPTAQSVRWTKIFTAKRLHLSIWRDSGSIRFNTHANLYPLSVFGAAQRTSGLSIILTLFSARYFHSKNVDEFSNARCAHGPGTGLSLSLSGSTQSSRSFVICHLLSPFFVHFNNAYFPVFISLAAPRIVDIVVVGSSIVTRHIADTMCAQTRWAWCQMTKPFRVGEIAPENSLIDIKLWLIPWRVDSREPCACRTHTHTHSRDHRALFAPSHHFQWPTEATENWI